MGIGVVNPNQHTPVAVSKAAASSVMMTPRQFSRICPADVGAVEITISPTTLKRSGKAAALAERWMGLGPFQSIQREPYASQGRCYLNVQDHCRKHGGRVAIGWAMAHQPGCFVVAVHHAVWDRPDGKLVDIRQLDQHDNGRFSTFVRDTTPIERLSGTMSNAKNEGLLFGRVPRIKYLALQAGDIVSGVIAHMERQADAEQTMIRVPVYPEYADQFFGVSNG